MNQTPVQFMSAGRAEGRQSELLKISDLRRFVAMIEVDDNGCWIWAGCKNVKGYGKFSVGGRRCNGGRDWWTHRWVYATFVGEIPEGMTVNHTCAKSSCCNPAHLGLMTVEENSADRHERDRNDAVGDTIPY